MMFIVKAIVALYLFTEKIFSEPTKCPSGISPLPFTPEEVVELRRQTTTRLWSNTLSLSNDAQRLRDKLLVMANSTNEDWQRLSSVASFWIWTYLPTLNNVVPNLCLFAQIVDNTPDWNATKNCVNLTMPLMKIVDQIQYGTLIIISKGLNNTRCGRMILGPGGELHVMPNTSKIPGPSPLVAFVNNETCVGSGREYNINAMLDFIGTSYRNVPGSTEDIKNILNRLYDSTSLQDNLIALMTFVAASPPLSGIISDYRNELKYPFFSLGGLTNLDQSCCRKYRKDMRQIYAESLIENIRVYNFAMDEYCLVSPNN